jgi:hypothetical protein
LLFLEPDRPGQTEFVVRVDHKLNAVGIKLGVAIREIDFGSSIRHVADAD